MQQYFAPMEGLTDRIYRDLHHRYFPGVDRYYTPFFSPTAHRRLTPKEQRELPRADTLPYCAIPQALTKNADDFLWMARQCEALGYREINLNLGCPSGTVTAKGKGAGMLQDPDSLDSFLAQIFPRSPIPISVKTRIGFLGNEEFPRILEVLNRYPICELTVHPRVRKAFYKGPVDMEAFDYAVKNSRSPLCYNGDITCREDILAIKEKHPTVGAVMIGRGLIGNPGMLTPGGTTADALERFHDELLDAYTQAFGGPRNAMFRLKENWFYLIENFAGGEKLFKRLRKTTDVNEYKSITREIFETLPLRQR